MLLTSKENENGTITGLTSTFADRATQRNHAQEKLNNFNAQNVTDTKALNKYMNMVNHGFSVQEALNLSMRDASEAATKHAMAMGGASNTLRTFEEQQNAIRESLQQNVDKFSLASLKSKALGAVWEGLATAGNMLVFALISKGIEMAVTAISNYINRVEIAKERLNETKQEFTSITSEIDGIESELKEHGQRIDELNGKKHLTYLEKAELSNLQNATRELEYQLSLKQQLAETKANELAKQNKEAFDLEFHDDSFQEKDVQELMDSHSNTGSHLDLENQGLEGVAAAYLKMQEGFFEAQKNKDTEAMNSYQEGMDLYKGKLLEDLSTLQEYRLNLNEILNYRELTGDEQQFYNNLEQGMKLIHSLISPNEWNAMAINDIFHTEGLEVSKEELIGMYNAGDLDEEAISNYKNLSQAIQESQLILGEHQTATAAFLEEIISMSEEVEEIFPLSFGEAFEADAFAEAKDTLLELAESGQLTIEAFQEVDGTDNFLTQIGLSAEEATKKVNAMVSSESQLAAFGKNISSLTDNLSRKITSPTEAIDASTFAGMSEELKAQEEEWKHYVQVLGTASSSVDEVQAATNELADAYLNSGNYLSQLTYSNRDYYTSQLRSIGISNAEDLVQQKLTEKYQIAAVTERALAITKDGVTEATLRKTLQMLTEANASDMVTISVANQIVQEQILANTDLNFNEKVQAIAQVATAYLGAAASAAFTHDVENESQNAKHSGKLIDLEGIWNNIYKEFLKLPSLKLDITVPSGASSGSGGSNTSTNTNTEIPEPEPKPVKEDYDWIERKLEVVKKETEKLGKAFENTFSEKSTQKGFTEYINQINSEISDNTTALSMYQKKLEDMGLAPQWIDRIINGGFAIDEIDNDDLKEKLAEYETYYNKQKECEERLADLKELKAQAEKSYAKKITEYYEEEINKTNRLIERRKALIALKEIFGLSASKKDMAYEQNQNANELSQLKSQIKSLENLQKTVTKGGEAWKTYQEQINSNKEKISDLTQSIADLAVELANLPLEKLDQYLEKNASKNELYEAKQSNATSYQQQNSILNKQINLVKNNNKETQKTVKTTAKNLKTSKAAFRSAKSNDKKNLSTSEKQKVDTYYKQLQSYVKKGKQIPASLITKLSDLGLEHLVKAATNYNAALIANQTAKETAKLTAETSKKETAELSLQKFHNIKSAHERKQIEVTQRADRISSAMNLSEAKGHLTNQSFYRTLIALETEKQKRLEAEKQKLQGSLDNAVKSGKIKEYSEEWWEMKDAIHAVDEELTQSAQSLQEFSNQLRQVGFDQFDFLQEQFSKYTSEADFYIDLMSEKPMTNKKGFTEHGTATLGLHYQNYETYMSQADQYGKEIKRIQKMLKENPSDTTLLSQLQEYQELQQQSILNAEKEKKAIANLVKEGYKALIDSLSKSIRKYKEFLQNAKSAHDFQKNISQQSENINTLKKQISAYASMSGSEEVSAKLQRLKVELENAQNSLQETMYDKYISDTQDALDNMLDHLEDYINNLELDMETLFKEGIGQVTDHTKQINKTLKDLSKDYGTSLSTAMKTTWGTYFNAEGGINAILKAFDKLIALTDKENDKKAYQTALTSYEKLDKYEKDLNKSKKEEKETKEKRKTAKENLNKAKTKLDEAEKKYGKNSKQYKNAYKNWQTAEEAYHKADKDYQNSKKKTSSLKKKLKNAKENNRPIVEDFLYSVVDEEPSIPEKKMDILDKLVYGITGGYLSERNKTQLYNLLGVKNSEQAIEELEKLGILKLDREMTNDIVSSIQSSYQDNPKKSSNPTDNKRILVENGKDNPKKPSSPTDSYQKDDFTIPVQPTITTEITPSIDLLPLQTDMPLASPNYTQFLPDSSSAVKNVMVTVGDVCLPNVDNPKEFATELVDVLKNDTTVQKTFETFVNTSLTGGNSLSTRKY